MRENLQKIFSTLFDYLYQVSKNLKIHGENYMFSEIGKKEIKVQKLKK